MTDITKNIQTLFAAFAAMILIPMGAVAQDDASHNVQVEMEPFTFVEPSSSGSLENITVKFNGTPGAGDVAELTEGSNVSITSESAGGGTINATVGSFSLDYGTNSQNQHRIYVSGNEGNFDTYVDLEVSNVAITNRDDSEGDAGTKQTGPFPVDNEDNPNDNIITGVTQAGGTFTFDYDFTVDQFAHHSNFPKAEVVVYTITPN